MRERKRLAPNTMEFFLILARHVCEKLQLPVYVGSHELGKRLVKSLAGKGSKSL